MGGRPLEVLIFGTGAVGSIFGWRVAQHAGVRLSVICRSNYDTVKTQGLQFRTDLWGSGHIYPNRVARYPHELRDVNFDYVVCANKYIPQQAHLIAESLRPAVRSGTTLVLAQNGVGVERPMRDMFPTNTLLSSICYISCIQKPTGTIEQVSQIKPEAFHIGVFGEGQTNAANDNANLQRLVELDSKFKKIEDVTAQRWSKMLFNGVWNPATALFGLDTHQILKGSPAGLALVRQLAHEISEVALLNGAHPPKDLDDQIIRSAALAPPIAPSMLQDARNRRQMEVEAMCGTICRMADQLGIQTPTVRATYQALLRMNRSFLEKQELLGQQEVGILEGLRNMGTSTMPVAAF